MPEVGPADGYEVTSLSFSDEGVVIAYMELPTDVRMRGQLAMQHQLLLDATKHPDYAEDVRKLHDRAVKMLRNALEDFNASEPYVPEAEDDDDDEEGMGDRSAGRAD